MTSIDIGGGDVLTLTEDPPRELSPAQWSCVATWGAAAIAAATVDGAVVQKELSDALTKAPYRIGRDQLKDLWALEGQESGRFGAQVRQEGGRPARAGEGGDGRQRSLRAQEAAQPGGRAGP